MSTTAIRAASPFGAWEAENPNATGDIAFSFPGVWNPTETDIRPAGRRRLFSSETESDITEDEGREHAEPSGWLAYSAENLRSIYDQRIAVTHPPLRALENCFARALIAAGEDSESVKPLQPQDVTRLLSYLVDAPSHRRNAVRDAIVQAASPEDVLSAALEKYHSTGKERYLDDAISLLEAVGNAAWPALRSLAESSLAECEYFVRLISDCAGVSAHERMLAFRDLAHSPHPGVRESLFEYLFQFTESAQRDLLQILSLDTEDSIRERATELLNELGH